MTTPRITHLRFVNFRGIEELDTDVGPGGLVISGPNGVGKTSALKGIAATLAGRGIGTDAIRLGQKDSLLLIDMENMSVQRHLRMNGKSTLEVRGADGELRAKASAFLEALFGAAPLDVVEFFKAEPKKQRQLLLSAMPAKITPAHLEAWLPEWARTVLGAELLANVQKIHGLEGITAIRKTIYEARTEKNALVKACHTRIMELERAVADLATRVPPEAPADAAAAATAIAAARARHAELEATRRRIDQQDANFSKSRKSVADLRAKAAEITKKIDEKCPSGDAIKDARDKYIVATTERDRLRSELDLAIRDADAKHDHLASLLETAEQCERDRVLALAHVTQANDLEAAVSATEETAPTPEEIAAASAAIEKATADAKSVQLAADLAASRAALASERDAARVAEETAGKYTAVVDRLTKEAPAQLIAESNGIPGLELTEDAISLDGVHVADLSGREQLLFAVRLAKRMHPNARFLVVDRLETVQPDLIPEFITEATADGWQIFGTRVADGDVTFDLIGSEGASA